MKLSMVMNERDMVGVMLPKWYGIAYFQYDVRRVVLYVIPLNLLVRFARKVYWRFYRWVKWDEWEMEIRDAYGRGYNDGNETRDHHIERMFRILQDGTIEKDLDGRLVPRK